MAVALNRIKYYFILKARVSLSLPRSLSTNLGPARKPKREHKSDGHDEYLEQLSMTVRMAMPSLFLVWLYVFIFNHLQMLSFS